MNHMKYLRTRGPKLEKREWPGRVINQAPIWCSVDLRDGNQALDTPMSLEQKVSFFRHLTDIGFKEIEIGFPASSDTEFAFTRHLIHHDLIPDDVTIQVLTPARDFIIRHTFESLIGAKQAIVHLYIPTSTVQREVVLAMTKQEVLDLATRAATLMKDLAESETYRDIDLTFEFSPESFMSTEPEFAVEICDVVAEIWEAGSKRKVIINLPNTVELTTASVFADLVEYYVTNSKWRDKVCLSVHTHNDRGGAVAASEMALQAGAERVEGTLFGNGERTGNCDLVILALNLLADGIDPKLDFSDIEYSRDLYEKLTHMQIPPRQPYVGDLVFTAFSGSHQDAIRKGMANQKADSVWRVPYLALDPADLGRDYEPIIRINSQSGRSGIAYIFEQSYGIVLPKFAQEPISEAVKQESLKHAKELISKDLLNLFKAQFVNQETPMKLNHFVERMIDDKNSKLIVELSAFDEVMEFRGSGTGIVDAFCNILSEFLGCNIEVLGFQQQALARGRKSRSMTYVELVSMDRSSIGVGESSSTTKSSLKAVMSAMNRLISQHVAVETDSPNFVHSRIIKSTSRQRS